MSEQMKEQKMVLQMAYCLVAQTALHLDKLMAAWWAYSMVEPKVPQSVAMMALQRARQWAA